VNFLLVSLDARYVGASPAKLAVIVYGLPPGESNGVTEQLALPPASVEPEHDSAPNPIWSVSPAIPVAGEFESSTSFAVNVTGTP
jgi:hypothetical protein